jgi:hypothetical protein
MAGPTYIGTAMAHGSVGAVPLPVVNFSFAAGQRIAVSTTSAQSAAISAALVALKSVDTDFWVTVGTSPTATVGATSFPVLAGETLFLPITSGQKVALITASGTGNVSVMPCV